MTQRGEIMKRCGLVGGGVGLALFAVFGLLQGVLLGGAAGIAVANYIFGEYTFEVMAGDLLPRILLAASMLSGVLVSLVMFLVAGAGAGVTAGFMLSLFVAEAKEPELATAAAGKKAE